MTKCGIASCLHPLTCLSVLHVEMLQDKQLRGTSKPPQLPADPLCVCTDLRLRDRFGAPQPLSSSVSDDGPFLLPRRLHPAKVLQTLQKQGTKMTKLNRLLYDKEKL